jgi:SSS family solute:Na+ symporter
MGMIAGVTTVAFLMLTGRDPFYGWSAGFVALCLNFAIAVLVSLAASKRHAPEPIAMAA